MQIFVELIKGSLDVNSIPITFCCLHIEQHSNTIGIPGGSFTYAEQQWIFF